VLRIKILGIAFVLGKLQENFDGLLSLCCISSLKTKHPRNFVLMLCLIKVVMQGIRKIALNLLLDGRFFAPGTIYGKFQSKVQLRGLSYLSVLLLPRLIG